MSNILTSNMTGLLYCNQSIFWALYFQSQHRCISSKAHRCHQQQHVLITLPAFDMCFVVTASLERKALHCSTSSPRVEPAPSWYAPLHLTFKRTHYTKHKWQPSYTSFSGKENLIQNNFFLPHIWSHELLHEKLKGMASCLEDPEAQDIFQSLFVDKASICMPHPWQNISLS